MSAPSFKDMMNEVVEYGSCCECGTCVLVCPHNVIDYVNSKPKQVAKASAPFDYCGISEGIGCDVCAQACPRLYPREHHLRDAVFGSDKPFQANFGVYRRIVVARCKDPSILDSCQDGGVVTTLLVAALRKGLIDGAVVSALDGNTRCDPVPKAVTTEEEIIAAGGSWYTYVPNNLALADALKRGLKKVAFVGVPCQVTPLRKLETVDDGFLNNGRKKDKHISQQRKFLKGFSDIVSLNLGLLCTEVFSYEGLMVQKIEGEMGIPLEEVRKFNVKGEVLIYKKDGEVGKLSLKDSQDYVRPECHHCADFSAELADISFGGAGLMGMTIVVIRTPRGEEAFSQVESEGLLEVHPIEEYERNRKIVSRLTRKQRERVPIPPGKEESFIRDPANPVPSQPK